MKYLHDYYPNATLVQRELWWHKAGLQQTASGYGKHLTSSWMVRLTPQTKRLRRVYVACFSNSGSPYVTVNGETFYVDDYQHTKET